MSIQSGDPWKGEHFGPTGSIARRRWELAEFIRQGEKKKGLLSLASALYGGATRLASSRNPLKRLRGFFLLREARLYALLWKREVPLPQATPEALETASSILLTSVRVSFLSRQEVIRTAIECASEALQRPDLKSHVEVLLRITVGEYQRWLGHRGIDRMHFRHVHKLYPEVKRTDPKQAIRLARALAEFYHIEGEHREERCFVSMGAALAEIHDAPDQLYKLMAERRKRNCSPAGRSGK